MGPDADIRLSDRYRLVARIGSGGMGSVWRAVDEVLEREVAVKVVAAQLSDDAEFVVRFRREAKAAARLDHPHIAHIYDYGEVVHDGRHVQYLVMELLPGRTLADRLRDGPIPWREAAVIGAQVAAGLAAAHRRGVVHRDITPGNIMLTPVGAKVLDFGISTVAGETSMTVAGRTLGTPAYLAPERLIPQAHPTARGSAEVVPRPGPAVDVYSLGALLAHAVSGRTPYEGSWSEQAHAHLYEPPPPITGVPDDFAHLVYACLAKDPGARPSTEDVAYLLRQMVGDDAAVALAGPAIVSAQDGSHEATRVLPAYQEVEPSGAVRPGSPSRLAGWVTLIAAIALAALVAANLLTRPPATPSGSASESDVSQQPTGEPTEQQAAETGDISVAETRTQILGLAAEALVSGDMTVRSVIELRRSLDRAMNQLLRDDFRDAEKTLDEAAEKLAKRLDDGDVTDEVYGEINDLIEVLAGHAEAAMSSGG